MADGHDGEDAIAHARDPQRLAALHALQLLDTPPEPVFDRLTAAARAAYEVPIALVSIVDADRQWFKSCIGVSGRETHLEQSFCAHAILSAEPLLISDAAQDSRFANHPAVVGDPSVRFYAGVPLTTREGHRVGTLCIADRVARDIQPTQLTILRDLAGVAESLMEMRAEVVRARQLAEHARRLAAVVETSEDAIITKQLDGTITGWNNGAERMYGYGRKEMISKNISILVPEGMANDVPIVLARVAAGQPVRHYETRRQTKDGRVLNVSLGVSPIHDESGAIVGAAVIARDITEARRLAAASEEQAEMLDLAEDAIFARDVAGRITYWNKAAEKYYGWHKTEALGRVSYELLKTRFPQPFEEIEQELFREGRWEGELIHTTRDGREIVVASRWAIRRDADGEPFQVLAINNDISAQKAAEEELRAAHDEADRANRSKTEFLSRMSHELRTPLNAILGFAQLLEFDDLTDDQRESTGQIIKGGQRLLNLINEVLDIARVESGQLAISIEPVPVAQTVLGSVDLIRPLAQRRSIEVVVDVAVDEHCHVLADRQRLDQVLLNLLSNAVKYNVDHGNIRLAVARPDQEWVRILVQDSGPGVAPEDLHRLFVPFDRVGAEQSEVEGTGLGLPLAKSLVEAMGGSIAVESHQGRGTTFSVELRAAGPPEAAVARQPERQISATDSATQTLLYIEDNLSNRLLLEKILRSQRPGMVLAAAMTGSLGIDLAHEHRPDLILLDLHLPDLEGEQVLARLKKDPRTAEIPIVILSADATPTRIKRLYDAGAQAYIAKPIDVKALMQILDKLLRPHEQS